MMLEGILSKTATALALGAIQAGGKKLRNALKKPEKQKAVERCAKAGLKALLAAGAPEDEKVRRDVLSVMEEFFRYAPTQWTVLNLLKGREVDAEEVVELFEAECEPHQLPRFDPSAGFEAFLDAFNGQLDDEPELQTALRTGLDRRKTAAQEATAEAVIGLPTRIVEEQRRGRKEDEAELEHSAREEYLRGMVHVWSLLPLTSLGGRLGEDDEITLGQVYVDLDTTTTFEEMSDATSEDSLKFLEGTQVSASLVTDLERRLVLLGAPGGGKSTFVRELLVRLARTQLGEVTENSEQEIDPDLLPILLDLRKASPKLAGIEVADLGEDERDRKLAEALREAALDELARDVPEFQSGLLEAWKSGRCLLVLDGLDEVRSELRTKVQQAVRGVCRFDPMDRIIVTCRVRSYHGEAELPGFKAHTLAPFDEEQIQAFCKTWYQALHRLGRLDREKAQEQGEDLAKKALLPAHRELAKNPMLLTTMALVHHQEVTLPRERVRLYERAVEILLWRWQKHKGRQVQPSEELAELLGDELKLRRIIQRLAFKAHEIGGREEGVTGLERKDVLDLLVAEGYLHHEGVAAELLDYVDQRTGILVGEGAAGERPDRYAFPHRTFQEYLAGRFLMSGRQRKDEVYRLAAEGDLWSVAVKMGVEALLFVQGLRDEVADLAYGLRRDSPETEQEQRAFLWSAKAAALLGIEFIERDVEGPQKGPEYLDRIRPALADLLNGRLPAMERAEVGRALARLGDPREEVLDVDAMELCWVPAGDFWLGSDVETAKEHQIVVFEEEEPQRKYPLEYGYWISRFPITQAQYRQFVKAGGYEEDQHWGEAEAIDQRPSGPSTVREPFSLPNHPAVGVSWFEALAFCRWLENRWLEAGWLPDGWGVTLPSEPEWEKAARGGLAMPTAVMSHRMREGVEPPDLELKSNPRPKRLYPWMPERTPVGELANCDVSGIEVTSAVGCFAAGCSPNGCEDMAGNVWEWTRSVFLGYPYQLDGDREDLGASGQRTLRGGSFARHRWAARCAYRVSNDPWAASYTFGFRVVCTPLQ